MIPIMGKAEVSIILSSNCGFVVCVQKVIDVTPSSRVGQTATPALFTASTIDETMIIVREQIELLMKI